MLLMSGKNKKKRTNAEMSFSPEQTQMDTKCSTEERLKDKTYFKELLGELLDEKFTEYLKPVKKDIAALESRVESIENNYAVKISEVTKENENLKDEIHRLETYQRRNNIKFLGLTEKSNEDIDKTVVDICNKYLPSHCLLDEHSFERIHRLGVFTKGIVRPIIARVVNYKDKANILKIQKSLLEAMKVTVCEDLPAEVERNRRQLYPIMAAIRSGLNKDDKATVFMRRDKLVVRGASYGVKDIDKLPKDINLHKLFTPSKGDITAFFTKHSMFSNHFRSKFMVNSKEYSSMEKFLFMEEAKLFMDYELVQKISRVDDPVEIKRLGKTTKGFKKDVWERNIDEILQKGLMAKFSQNPKLRDALLATGDTVIAEANRSDNLFGIGLSLGDQRIWNKENWTGKNLMGAALMTVRKTLSKI